MRTYSSYSLGDIKMVELLFTRKFVAITHHVATHTHPDVLFLPTLTQHRQAPLPAETFTEAQLQKEISKAYELGRQAGVQAATEAVEKEEQRMAGNSEKKKKRAIVAATTTIRETAASEAENTMIITSPVAASSSTNAPPSEACPSYHATALQPPHQGRRKPGECVGPRGSVWSERGFNYYLFRDMFYPYEKGQSEFKSLVLFTAGRSAMANIDGLVRLWGLDNFDYVLMHFDDSATEWNQ